MSNLETKSHELRMALRQRSAIIGRQHILIAIGVLILGLIPRVVGLGGFLTIDEIKWIEGAGQFVLALQSGDLGQTYWHFFPGITITWGETLVLWLAWLSKGGTLASFVAQQVSDPARTIGLFRLPGALLTALFAPGAYLLLRSRLGDWTAALAGGLLVLNPFFLAHSRIVNGDATAAGLMVLSLFAFMRLWWGSGYGMAALSGGLAGLALLTKLPAPLVVPFTGLLAIAGWWRDRRSTFWLKAVVVWGLAALLVFVLAWPAMWIEPVGTLQKMWRDTFDVGEIGEGHSTFYRGQVVNDPGWGFYPYAVAFRLTPLTLVGLFSLLVASALVRRTDGCGEFRWLSWSLAAYVLFIYVFSSLSPKKLDRYVMAVFPALEVLAALGYAHVLGLGLRVSGLGPATLRTGARAGLRVGSWLLIVGVLLVAFVGPHYPYYLGYYNPVLGGIGRAALELPVGWGEGLEEAAAWLNGQPEAERLRVSAWYSDIFFPYFLGERLSFSSSGKSQLAGDYVVFYINQVQRQKPDAALISYFQSRQPAYTLALGGVPWVWVYPAPAMGISMPETAEIEGRAELLGMTLPPGPCETGQSVPVRLFFRTLGEMPENETWQVALTGDAGQPVATARKRPASWATDSILEYEALLELPQDLRPGSYALQVSLWDEVGQQQVAQFSIPSNLARIEVVPR
jgi:4-amino-4-deoxy-L-arabinose transferase-like glycosyltransferase